ncbi:MAG TPA: hypothetical protein QGF58_09980 [Myxococcota bacterium]|nr:hypothetical protein [Myxococcota bacterium]
MFLLLACAPAVEDSAAPIESGPIAWATFESPDLAVELLDPDAAEGPIRLDDEGHFERGIVELRESLFGDYVGIELIQPDQGSECTFEGECGFAMASTQLTAVSGEVVLRETDEVLGGFVHVARLDLDEGLIDFAFEIQVGDGWLSGEVVEGRIRP